LRKTGSWYREIARTLGIDVHTAHADIAAELAALRQTAVTEATELRALECVRLDGMISGLWPQIQARVTRQQSRHTSVGEKASLARASLDCR